MVVSEVLWMPRAEAEDAVRSRKLVRLDGKRPVAIGLHPKDTRLACLLTRKLTDRDPLPFWPGFPVYMLDSLDFS